MKVKTIVLLVVMCFLAGFAFLSDSSATVTDNIIHTFMAGSNDGASPKSGPILSGSTLYGTTYAGGPNGYGTIYKVNTDGSGFTILHKFNDGLANDGYYPYGSLTLSGSTLFGTTSAGGSAPGGTYGTIFKINTDGTNYTKLWDFYTTYYDQHPYGSLTLSGTTLYGMTSGGGKDAPALGTIFKINAEGGYGSGYNIIHEFKGGASDGSGPFGSLTLSGTTLYGMTELGGHDNEGTVFKMSTDGTGFQLLHSFNWLDGGYPLGNLTLSGSTLYGMATGGGDYQLGVVFKVDTDGNNFSVLHSFKGTDGRMYNDNIDNSLTLSGSKLYGMTYWGNHDYDGGGVSTYGKGLVFSIDTSGTNFTVLYEFNNSVSPPTPDGGNPVGSLVGTNLYGATVSSTAANSHGTIFYLTGATLIRLASFSAIPSPRGMTITWRTGAETDNAGYNIWRNTEENGTYTKLTSSLIPATGAPIQGASYTWRDAQAQADTVYYYKLEDIDSKGTSTFHGPLSADTNVAVGPASDNDRMVSLFLKKGWNFISLPLQPKDPSITPMLSDISPSMRIIWGYDNEKKAWLKYSPSGSLFTVHCSLQSIEAGKGYWIFMTEEGVLTYAGQLASLQAVKLFPGWNLIGHRGIGMKPIAPALSLLTSKWKNIWNWTDDTWRMRSAALPVPPSFPSLNDLSQGKAYWIQVAPGAGATEWAQ